MTASTIKLNIITCDDPDQDDVGFAWENELIYSMNLVYDEVGEFEVYNTILYFEPSRNLRGVICVVFSFDDIIYRMYVGRT